MTPIDEARRADTRHSIIMGIILLLIGFADHFAFSFPELGPPKHRCPESRPFQTICGQ
jgi:hypothetical protein